MDSGHQNSDVGLLLRLQAGDEEAFLVLYRRLQGPVYRFALHMSGNRALAEDVVQETFMTLIQQSERFDPLRGQVSAFVFGIARNHLMRRFERDRRMVPFPEAETEAGAIGKHGNPDTRNNSVVLRFSAPVDLARNETIEHVRDAVLDLPAHYREVVVLCDLQEISYEDAAGVLQCPVGTVRSRLHRARALLAIKLRAFRQTKPVSAVARVGARR